MAQNNANSDPKDQDAKEASGRKVNTPIGMLPLPPWWVLAASVLLLPALLLGAMLWGTGWLIALRWHSDRLEAPKDARYLMAGGAICARAVFLPTLFYFAQTSQSKYALFRGALWAGGKGAKKVGSQASKAIRDVVSGDGDSKK